MAAVVLLDSLFRRKRRRQAQAIRAASSSTTKSNRSKISRPEVAGEMTKCRICLKEDQTVSYIPIFKKDSDGTIAEDIRKYGDIEISEEDELPKVLCEGCHKLLQGAVLFRQQAQAADRRLRSPEKWSVSYSDDDVFNNTDALTWDNDDKEEIKEQYNCDKCHIDFANATEYMEHRRTEAHKRVRVPCPECQQSVAFRYLPVHMARMHDAVQPFICDVCGKTFPVKGSFKRHLMTHTDQLPHKCLECPYRGRFRESLKLHMRVHTGEKPYACDQCPAQFINASNLNKHKRTHRAHDFKCEQCDRGFYTLLKLKEHFRVDHTGLKEHRCNICGKEFAYRKQLMKHTRKVHHRPKLCYGRLPLYLQIERKRLEQERRREAAAEPEGT